MTPLFSIYGQRYHAYDPFILSKDMKGVGKAGDVIDDGQPKKLRLGQWSDATLAEGMAENIRNAVPKRSWKIFIEKEHV